MQILKTLFGKRHRPSQSTVFSASSTTIFVSSTTSATGSMARIFRVVLGQHLMPSWAHPNPGEIKTQFTETGQVERAPPEQGHLLFVNNPHLLPSGWIGPKYRYIVNFRDPRDRVCNMYHWQFSHPSPLMTAEERANHIEKLRKAGIDKWAILKSKGRDRVYDRLFQILEEHPGQCLVLTYARLCLDFDGFIHRLSQFTGVPVNEHMWNMWRQLEIERPENLEDNPKWVGNRWEGSDVVPGRYKRELQPETIEIINEKMKPYLRRMAKYDPDYAHLYLEGL